MCYGTFVHFSRDICPKNAGHFWDIFGQAWDKNGTGLGHGFPLIRILPLKWAKMGHLSGHSSLEIEYRVRDRERENHPPVPPLKGGLRCAKKIDIF